MRNSNTMGHQGLQASLFILLWVLFVFLLETCSFSWDLKWTHLCAVPVLPYSFQVLQTYVTVKIYELWPFSFLLLVMQLSEDTEKKQRFTMYQCLAFCYKASFVQCSFCYKIDCSTPQQERKLNLKIKNIFGLFFAGAILLYHEYYKKKLSDSEYFFFVDFWNHYE